MKVAFFTLGCKVNQYESQVLKQQFKSNNFEIVEPSEFADVYVVNSCTVTVTSDKKTRQIVNRLKSINNNAIVVLTGCFPQAFPQKANQIEKADIITGTKDRTKIIELVLKRLSSHKNNQEIYIQPNDQDKLFEKMAISKFDGKTRAFIKIQDGCNRFCSYCIIPKSRGRVRSKLISDIISEVTALANSGHKEIVLTGINLSSYGQDLGINLVDAVESIAKIDKIKRIRLSSLEPDLLSTKDITRLSRINKFCPFFHLCLQSGCDKTLQKMNRHYSTKEYLSVVKTIRENFKNPAISTDLIVGFPEETNEDFNETLEFIKLVNFAKMHIFPYSKRPGTRAASMKDQIHKAIKHERCLVISNEAKKMQSNFFANQIGTTSQVLFETLIGNNLYQGYSENYTPVVAECKKNICGQIKNVNITKSFNDHCIGEILS